MPGDSATAESPTAGTSSANLPASTAGQPPRRAPRQVRPAESAPDPVVTRSHGDSSGADQRSIAPVRDAVGAIGHRGILPPNLPQRKEPSIAARCRPLRGSLSVPRGTSAQGQNNGRLAGWPTRRGNWLGQLADLLQHDEVVLALDALPQLQPQGLQSPMRANDRRSSAARSPRADRRSAAGEQRTRLLPLAFRTIGRRRRRRCHGARPGPAPRPASRRPRLGRRAVGLGPPGAGRRPGVRWNQPAAHEDQARAAAIISPGTPPPLPRSTTSPRPVAQGGEEALSMADVRFDRARPQKALLTS